MRAWAAVFALAIALMGVVALSSVAQALPPKFWGVVPQVTPTPSQLQRIKLGGVSSIRIPISWAAVEPRRGGAPDWSSTDGIVKEAAQEGVDVLPFVYGAPAWAVAVDRSRVPGTDPPWTLPVRNGKQRAAWTSFLQLVVGRYGPNGSFWAENTDVPKRPIRTWQIWNEENFFYFVARPSPADYGKLVRISHTAITSVDRGAKIVLGGMFAMPSQAKSKRRPRQAYFATDFLNQMYKSTRGIKADFGGVALHPYTPAYRYLTPEIEAVRTVLKANRDAAKGLWITELGWSSGRPRAANNFNSFEKGPRGQANQLVGAFKLLRKNQAKWRLQRVYWFSLDDHATSCNFCDGSGLFGAGFRPKPSWRAFVRFAGGVAG